MTVLSTTSGGSGLVAARRQGEGNVKKRVEAVEVRMLRNRYARTAETREFAEELVGEDPKAVEAALKTQLREKGSKQTLHPRVAATLMQIGAAEPAEVGTGGGEGSSPAGEDDGGGEASAGDGADGTGAADPDEPAGDDTKGKGGRRGRK